MYVSKYNHRDVKLEVKRIGLNRNFAGNLAKGVEQVGNGGVVIVVRPKNSPYTLLEYQRSINKFTPKCEVIIRVIDEASLPKIK